MQHHGGSQCPETIGLPALKKTIRATEQDRPDVKAQRKEWAKKTADLDPKRLVFVDESGAKTNLTPRWGRLKKGRRLYDSTPAGRWNTTTVVSSVRLDGSTPTMVLAGACDGDAFRSYVNEILTPSLRPGDIVVLDNLSIHKVKGITDAVENVGAELWYLPPYSPDLNPIEKMFSKLKTNLRRAKARTEETLYEAIGDGLKTVTASDTKGWFTSCGYGYTIS